MRDVYHHFTMSSDINRSLFTALKAGGRLAVIDFEAAPGSKLPNGVPANRGGHGIRANIWNSNPEHQKSRAFYHFENRGGDLKLTHYPQPFLLTRTLRSARMRASEAICRGPLRPSAARCAGSL